MPGFIRNLLSDILIFTTSDPRRFFEEAVVGIDPKDRVLVPLPEKIDFLYHVIWPMRLVGKYGVRVARTPFQAILGSSKVFARPFRSLGH